MGQTVFTASNAAWPTPGDWNNAANFIEGIGGGAGGQDNVSGNGTGGGGGAYGKAINQTLAAGNNNVTVGALGAGGTGSGNAGAGGATSFKNVSATTLMSANGGGVGSGSAGGAGGTTGTGSTVHAGGPGGGQSAGAFAGGTGGGGAGGPLGTGTGGTGGVNGAGASGGSGGGGGGSGGGSNGGAGTAGTTQAGGVGGNNTGGSGGGAAGSNAGGNGGAGSAGGGGGGGGINSTGNTFGTGGTGSTENGTTYTPSWGASTNGSGGGGGGAGGGTTTGVAKAGNTAGNYGGGGGGGGTGSGTGNGGAGAPGIVVVTWTSSAPLPYTDTGKQRMFWGRYAPDTNWVGTPQIADTLIIQAMAKRASQEQINLSRIHTVPEPYWMGTPLNADAAILSLLLLPIVHAPIYAPKPDPHPGLWLGAPIHSASIFTPVSKPFGAQWEYHYEPDKYWLGEPVGSLTLLTPQVFPFSNKWSSLYTLEWDKLWQGMPFGIGPQYQPPPALNVMFRAPLWVPRGTDPTNWQQYSWPTNKSLQIVAAPFTNAPSWGQRVAPAEWVVLPRGSNTLAMLTAGGTPFSNEWSVQYSWDSGATGWYWGPTWGPLPALPLTIPKPYPLNKQLWRYDFDVEAPNKWQGSPAPADTLTMLVAGGAPFFKQWEYNFEPDKFWQGAPIQTNIEFFPFLIPFRKQWEYHYEPDKYWQGSPRLSNTVNLSQFAPFANEWTSQYSWDSDVKLWGAVSQPADTMWIHVMGGVPTHRQWRYDLEFDKLWQGAPTPTNIEFFPFVKPFFKQWEYNLDFDKYWQGSPIQSYSVNLPSVRPVFKQWHYDYNTSESWWSWAAPQSPTLFSLGVGSKPFGALWRYDLEPDKYWQGTPVSINIESLPFVKPSFKQQWHYDYNSGESWWSWNAPQSAPLFELAIGNKPFGAFWRYDLDFDKYWQGNPIPPPAPAFTPKPPPISTKLWRWDYDVDVRQWQRYSMPAVTQNILVEGGKPFFKQWRYDLEPDKYWVGAPIPTNIRFFPFLAPFSNEWASMYAWDSGATYWLGVPTGPYPGRIPILNPFSNEWSAFPYDSGLTYWQGKPVGTTQAQLSFFVPFSNEWASLYAWDSGATYWQGAPRQTNIRFFPFVAPFSNEWSSLYTLDSGFTYWLGTPSNPFAGRVPLLGSFSNEWASQTAWDSDVRLWQGKPTGLFSRFISVIPPRNMWAPLYTQDSDVRLWRFSDYVKQNAVITFKFRVFPTGPMYLQETIDIPPFWQGHPTFLPPFLINVAIAVLNPDDMLPRFGHPLFPRRRDPLFLRGDDWRKLSIPDDPLFPRRKDPLK